MIYRPPSYQQCVAVGRIARAGGIVDDAQLRELVGRYAGNIIEALIDRGIIFRNHDEHWQLTDVGMEIATELLGPAWKAGTR